MLASAPHASLVAKLGRGEWMRETGSGGGEGVGGGWVNEPVWREDMREGEWARTQKLE